MEYFDIVDENGVPTGKIVTRKEAHEKGIRHRTAHVWIVNKTDKGINLLFQKRSANKESFPSRLDTSSAGHIPAGDEPLDSAIRELGEELGIFAKPEDLTYIGTFNINYCKEFHSKMFCDNEYTSVYIYQKDVVVNSLVLQTEEVESVCWCEYKQAYNECKNHNPKFCAPINGLKLAVDWIEQNLLS